VPLEPVIHSSESGKWRKSHPTPDQNSKTPVF
jgi:hypothetical protein